MDSDATSAYGAAALDESSTRALDRLRSLLGEPECWGWARPQLWEAAEDFLGCRLPEDYKAFLDLYGPGSFDGLFWLGRPTDGTREELERLWSMSGRPSHDEDPERYPFPFHPQEGGLIEWGGDESAAMYYFLAEEPDPADWRIVVETECGEWHEAAGPFSEFLLHCVEGVPRPSFLGRYRPGPTVTYHQTAES
ncbi:SMI1/KNR4 family protein [Streptomyces xanthophaeus]|uniref:SMI1/KNR4 family protein n=1 Tax=Streptomyces xanthophaeus TaxID=67385 RepID=UPI003425A833